jgi:glycerate dehydrogenase
MKIVVLDGYTLNPGDNPWTPLEALGELIVYDRTPAEDLVARAAEGEIILTNKAPLTADTLARLPRLRFIAVTATGYNIVDVEAARRQAVPVSNVPEYSTDGVAQYVFAVLLHFCHHCALHDQLIRDGHWHRLGEFSFWERPLVELAGKTMGIVGFGRIGRRVGQLAHAFGMHVVAHDVRPGEPPSYQPFSWCGLEETFARADIVSLHCPQTAETVGMVNGRLLSQMKPTALLINAARGGLVEEQDLADALSRGVLAGAALDVLSREPPDPQNPLLRAPHCLLTPHIAWATIEARRRLMAATARNVEAFLRGAPENVVN